MNETQDTDSEEENRVLFGKLLRKQRAKLGLTQSELAAIAFGETADKSQISAYERGRFLPRARNLKALASALEISEEDLDSALHQASSKPGSKAHKTQYRPIRVELRLANQLFQKRVGKPFSFALFAFSMSLSQLYSVATIVTAWLFFTEVGNFGSLQFLPDWSVALRLFMVVWATFVIVLTLAEIQPNRISQLRTILSIQSDETLQISLRLVASGWLSSICLMLWIGPSLLAGSLACISVFFAWHRALISNQYTAFTLISVVLALIAVHVFKVNPQLASVASATVLSGLGAAMLANCVNFMNWKSFVFGWVFAVFTCAVLSVFQHQGHSSSITQIVAGLTPVIIMTTIHVRVDENPSPRWSPFHRLGITVFIYASLISLGWPSELRHTTSSVIWPIFYVLLPVSNALCDFVSMSCTIHSMQFLIKTNDPQRVWQNGILQAALQFATLKLERLLQRVNPKGGHGIIARVTTTAVFELSSIVLVFALLIILTLFSLVVADIWVSGSFSADVGLEQFSEPENRSGAWIYLLLLTVFAPTIFVSIWAFLFATRIPNYVGQTGSSSLETRYDVMLMRLERSHARIALIAFLVVLYFVAKGSFVASSSLWLADLVRVLIGTDA